MAEFCLRTFFVVFVGCAMWHTDLSAQRLTFADTYPTNNIDSLKTWLKTHPQPTEERLKNLIRLERTYFFMYPENMGDQLAEIKSLSVRLHSSLGQNAHSYLAARAFMRDEKRIWAFESFHKAYEAFLKSKDTSGIIHASAGLVSVNYGNASDHVGDTLSAYTYLQNTEALLKNKPNTHDAFLIMAARITYLRGVANPDFPALLKYAKWHSHLCNSNPAFAYARIAATNYIGIGYQYTSDYHSAYRVFKKLLAGLASNQLYIRIRTLYNLGLACQMLNLRSEQLQHCEEALVLLEKLKKKCPYPQMEYNLSHALHELYSGQKNFEKAHYHAYQLLVLNRTLAEAQQSEALINLTKKYELSEKQKQIAELSLQQTQVENRNRLTIVLLSIACVVAMVLGYLGIRLRRANQQLYQLTQSREQLLGIVAHDLRRPLSTFHGMAEMVNSALKMGDFTAIEALSRSIDQSGAKIQQLLDNIVAWTLSQYVELPHHPVFFSLQERVLNTVNIYQNIYTVKKPSFEVLLDKTWQLYMDVNAFDLIVRNLIDNALKATDQPVHIKITAQYPAPEYIEICFEDNAGGMSPQKTATIQRVFDDPERAQISQNGLGMGLVMIGRFVKRNGGSISVESQEGVGTTFTIRLPAKKES